jgi:hypothetical protein
MACFIDSLAVKNLHVLFTQPDIKYELVHNLNGTLDYVHGVRCAGLWDFSVRGAARRHCSQVFFNTYIRTLLAIRITFYKLICSHTG